MDDIFRNKYLNYGYLTMLTGVLVVGFIVIHHGDYSKFTTSIKLSMFNIKLVLSLVIIATYLTFAIPSARMIIENKVKLKTPPRGDRGLRGNRGKLGKDAACSTCGDDLCYKKLLYNITKTINFWRQNNNMELLEQNYIIPNEFIKDKVKKHCSSNEFKELLNKYGSNNDNTNVDMPCPDTICTTAGDADCKKKCGAYDYMFKMWSIWILIILRYKNGMFFLESEGLNERDFNGLVEKEDAFQVGDTAKLRSNGTPVVTITDNSEFPFYTVSDLPNNVSNSIHISRLKKNDTDGANTEIKSWQDMFLYDEYPSVQPASGPALSVDERVKELIEYLDMVRRNTNGDYSFKCLDSAANSDPGGGCINMDFIELVGRVPGGGLETPFDEIKKYKSWYWGSDPASQPNITFNLAEPSTICEICSNSSLCSTNTNSDSKMGIRVRITNSYKLLVNTSIFDNDDSGKPFRGLTSNVPDHGIDNNSSIFSVNHFTDPNEDPMFSEYKPLGDVLFNNNDIEVGPRANIQNCRPNDNDLLYEGPLFDAVTGVGAKSGLIDSNKVDGEAATALQGSGHVYTMLVSGPDLKPPISYTFMGSINKKEGINKGYETINIWKPIAPTGYTALGYVVDMRPNKDISANKPPSSEHPNTTSAPMPSRDRIYTVPNSALSELGLTQNSNLSNINLYHPNDMDLSGSGTGQTRANHICSKNTTVTRPQTPQLLPSANHDKKYSIMRVYEEDEFND